MGYLGGGHSVITIDVRHDGLGRLARVVAPIKALAEKRADALLKRWEAAFQRREQIAKAGQADYDAWKKLEAEERSREAEAAIAEFTSLLITALQDGAAVDWNPQYDISEFAEAKPVAPEAPPKDVEPLQTDFPPAPFKFAMLWNWRVLFGRKKQAQAKFEAAHKAWAHLKSWREQEYVKAQTIYAEAFAAWDKRKSAFLVSQAKSNERLKAQLEAYQRGEPDGVVGRADLALLSLDRPEGFPAYWTLRFANGVLLVEYDLPSLAVVPVVKAVKYAPTRGAYQTVALSEPERERLYGEAVFQTCLAVLHTIFAADTAGVIRSISFNGWANYIDGVALHPGRACILAVAVDRARFAEFDLAAIDPKALFRALNGSMSPKLAALAAG